MPVNNQPAVNLSNIMSAYYKEMAVWKTFGSGNEGGTGEWRKLHIEELHDVYPLNVIGVIRSTGLEMEGERGRAY